MFGDSAALFQYYGFSTILVKGASSDNGKTVRVQSGSRTWNATISGNIAKIKMLPAKKDYTIAILNGASVEKTITEALGFGETKTVYTKATDPLEILSNEINVAKKSVSDGKSKVASAITNQGVSTATDATFDTMAANVGTVGYNKYNAGYSNGYNAGNSAGYSNGYNAGNSAGYSNGYNAGYAAAPKYHLIASNVSGARTFSVPAGLSAGNFLIVPRDGVSNSAVVNVASQNGMHIYWSGTTHFTKGVSGTTLTTNAYIEGWTNGTNSTHQAFGVAYDVYGIGY